MTTEMSYGNAGLLSTADQTSTTSLAKKPTSRMITPFLSDERAQSSLLRANMSLVTPLIRFITFTFTLLSILTYLIYTHFYYKPITLSNEALLSNAPVINYSQMYISRPNATYLPYNVEELRDVVLRAREDGFRVKVVGGAHAMSDIAYADNRTVLISLNRMNRFMEVLDYNKVRVEAGIRIFQLNEKLQEHDLALSNMGQIAEQSIAGATATSTHGTGIHYSSISSQIMELTIMDANGVLHTASRTQNPELFDAARSSLGALGIVVELVLQTERAFNLHRVEYRSSLFEVEENFETLLQNEHFRYWWFPHTKGTKVIILNRSNATPSKFNLIRHWLRYHIEVPVFCSVLSLSAWLSNLFRNTIPTTMHILFPLATRRVDEIGLSYTQFTGPVGDSYSEIELFVPIEKFFEAHARLRRYLDEEAPAQFNFINENRFIRADDIWLSPFYRRDSASISVILYRQPHVFEDFAQRIERIMVEEFDARVHFGKWNTADAARVRRQYEKYDDFQRVRRQMDRDGLFLNDYLERLFVDKVL